MNLYEPLDVCGYARGMGLLSREKLAASDADKLAACLQEPVPEYVPSRYELLVLAQHWATEAMNVEDRVGDEEYTDTSTWRSAEAAWKRLDAIAELFDGREISDLLEALAARREQIRSRAQQRRQRLVEKYQRAVLEALARYPDGETGPALSAVAGVPPKDMPELMYVLLAKGLVERVLVEMPSVTGRLIRCPGWCLRAEEADEEDEVLNCEAALPGDAGDDTDEESEA